MSEHAKRIGRAVDADGNTVVEFIGPGKSEDALSESLCLLTHQLQLLTPKDQHSGGVFGGRYGYGVAFENDVFMMHPFCWCEKSECQWCASCECQHRYMFDGAPITEDEYHEHLWRRSDDQMEREQFWKRIQSERIEPHCVACQGALLEPWGGERAPNFYHKASGLQVWWYKYIGRDMEVVVPSDDVSLGDVISSCLASISAPSLDDALKAYAAACDQDAEDFKKSMEWAFSDEGRKFFDSMVESGAVRVETFGFGKKDDES